MEKLIYLMWAKPGQGSPAYREALINEAIPSLRSALATRIRLNLADDAVAPAIKLRIESTKPAPDAMVSFWLDSAVQRQPHEKILLQHSEKIMGYLVTESVPLDHAKSVAVGKRVGGMNQVVLLRKPVALPADEWLDIWLNSHTAIAMETQSTFGYRQNVVTRKLTGNAMDLDAIVEENFPAAAMTSAHAFYNADGDDQKLKNNRNRMFTSVQRFLDLARLDCLPMSEYNF